MMYKSQTIVMILSTFFLLVLQGCTGSKTIKKDKVLSHTSVHIQLTDGSTREGIIVTSKNDQLIFVDAASNRVDTLHYLVISDMRESQNIYDFFGNKIPRFEIHNEKKFNNTLLYSGAGMFLGTAVGFGAFVAIVLTDSSKTTPATLTMAACSIAGAVFFGKKGYNRDFQNAVENIRKRRYELEKQKMIEERQRLEELKKQHDGSQKR